MGPTADQIELTVFGPGYGECSVIHIGSDQWVIIDSCIDNSTGKPAALSYLASLGVDFSQAVRLVVATHWHDDHVRGISTVVDQCKQAKFCTSSALTKTEFATAAHLYASRPLTNASSGMSEMYKVLKHLEEGRVRPIRALADRRVFQVPASSLAHGEDCEIWTLSPSDGQLELFVQHVSSLIPNIRETKRRAPDRGPNHMSIVTWVKIGQLAMLLGADLERTADMTLGWLPIVLSSARPQGKARLFKIPHHGSENGHSTEVWTNMVEADALAVVTPYARGRKHLPTQEDIARILGRAARSYTTSRGRLVRVRRREPTVERMIARTVKSIRSAEPQTGMVRFRNGGAANPTLWTVEVSDGACALADLVA